ncbi:MAG: dipeptide epimerase [Anaerolineae bacterium]|jgi:L-alanine-DL-glutamate epimerase-like enolase superfamily enzyme
MQITTVEVIPVELDLRLPYRTAYHDGAVESISTVFIRVETTQGREAWGCAAFDPAITGETKESVVEACEACARRARYLSPLNTEFALDELSALTEEAPSALCAFDLAFHDLLGLAADMPLYRLLGGYRSRIQTSITISIADVAESVALARRRAAQGFRILKIKGGLDPEEDVRRVRAINNALPRFTLRLDADQGYTVQQALDVARALEGKLEMLEQPTVADDLDALLEVTRQSPVPILADESVSQPPSALEVAKIRAADGMSVKLTACGGLRCARQIDTIARVAQMHTMVSCVNQPALLTAAGLSFALSSRNVEYGDLDGHFDLLDDPTIPGFRVEEGWLIATDVPGLGCTVDL